jgi:Domain of unknown function (DUF1996)
LPGGSSRISLARCHRSPPRDILEAANGTDIVAPMARHGSATPSGARWVKLLVLASVVVTTSPAIPAVAGDSVGWVNVCGFVRHRRVDPIVYPRQSPAGHLHDFFGNKGVTAYSTLRSLRLAGTTCAARADKAGYWVPALYSRGNLIRPRAGTFYYRSIVYPRSSVRAFPPGLKVIAGDGHATSRQDTNFVYWGCSTLGGADPARDHPIDCGTGWVTAHVNFPDCWDGVRRDSVDHKRHMAYSIDPNDDDRYRCPRHHPVPVPRLIFALEWPVHDGTRIRLSSGPFYTLHADFWNAWVQTRLRRLVHRCIHAEIDCDKIGS